MFKTKKSQVRIRSTHFGALMLATGVIVGIAIGGVGGVIAASSTSSKIVACANKKTGAMRYSKSAKCAKTETKVSWNTAGTNGTNGTAGAAGAKGETGAAGTNGTNGTNATLAITQQSVCDGTDAGTVADEVCKVGMNGPGGGLIFFVDYNNEYPTYDYLEAAPADAAYASTATGAWATSVAKCGATAPQSTSCLTATIYTETAVALATIRGLHRGLFGGKAATEAIVARHDAGAPAIAKNLYAAGVADDYAVNGKTDWWLPSRDELAKMQENLNNKGVGGFAADYYWSSSEFSASFAWLQYFTNGGQYGNFKDGDASYVRPVRAF